MLSLQTCIACGRIGAMGKGKSIHAGIERKGLVETNCTVGNALVDLYAKCGESRKAWIIFKGLSAQDMCYGMFGINEDGYMALKIIIMMVVR